jgi:hypothetical protein
LSVFPFVFDFERRHIHCSLSTQMNSKRRGKKDTHTPRAQARSFSTAKTTTTLFASTIGKLAVRLSAHG